MAQVRDVRLQLGMNPEMQHLAEVAFAVEFSQAELNQNINFGLYVTVLQYDPRVMNHYQHLNSNGAFEFGNYSGNQGNASNSHMMGREQGVLWIAREVIRPAGTKTHYFQRKCSFQRPQQSGLGMGYNNGDFVAHVNVIPEITEGRGWSQPYKLGNNQIPFGNYTNGQSQFMNEQAVGSFASNLI